jgi:hypothetical protein
VRGINHPKCKKSLSELFTQSIFFLMYFESKISPALGKQA